MKIKALILLLILSYTLGTSVAFSSEKYIYKWKDEKGVTQYSERQPALGTKFVRVRQSQNTSLPSTPSEASTKSSAPLSKKSRVDANETGGDDNYKSWQQENCKIAKQNLDILLNAGRVAQDDGKGGKRLMTDEEKQEQIEKMTAQKDKYCNSDSEK